VVGEALAQHFSEPVSLSSQGLRRIIDQDYKLLIEAVLGDREGFVEGLEVAHGDKLEAVAEVAEVAGAVKHWYVGVR
jgi:hypothetical protein